MKIVAITATVALLVPSALHAEGKGVVDTYPSVDSGTGLAFAADEGWIWQTSYDTNNGETVTVDPATGAFTTRFHVPDVVGVPGTEGKGLCYDEDDQYLYITDWMGDSLTTYGDAIYCLDVSNPNSPSLVDVWDFGSLNGIAGIAQRGSHFYVTYSSGFDIVKYSLHPGGSYTVENTWNVTWGYPGCIHYKESNDTFYISSIEGWDIFVTDGANPASLQGCFGPGCLIYGGITMVDDFYIWISHPASNENHVVEDENLSFESATWGGIKATP